MNTEAIKQEIKNLIDAKQEQIRYARQYPASKTRTNELKELGVLEFMPSGFGNTDAQVIIDAMKQDGKQAIGNHGSDDWDYAKASRLFQLMNEPEKESKDDNEISSAYNYPNAVVSRAMQILGGLEYRAQTLLKHSPKSLKKEIALLIIVNEREKKDLIKSYTGKGSVIDMQTNVGIVTRDLRVANMLNDCNENRLEELSKY